MMLWLYEGTRIQGKMMNTIVNKDIWFYLTTPFGYQDMMTIDSFYVVLTSDHQTTVDWERAAPTDVQGSRGGASGT